jgi:beta-exotoxin I transport system permease protein
MSGVVFFETLKRGSRTMFFWGTIIGLIAFLNIIAVPNVDGLKASAEAIAKMPPIVLQMIGGGDMAFLSTPEGYLSEQYFGIALVIFAIYGIVAGLNITANEEDKGILDVVLSLPVSRWRVVLERFLAYCLLAVSVIVVSSIILWIGILITPSMTVNMGRVIEAIVNILPGTLMTLAFTMFIATILRRRSQAIVVAAVFVIASYFVDFLGRAASTSLANDLRTISYFRYYDAVGVMQNGLSWGNVAVLLVVTTALLAASIWFFQRRDVAV